MAQYDVTINGTAQAPVEAADDNTAVDAARAAAAGMSGELAFEVSCAGRHVSQFSCFHEPVTPASPAQ
jgi:hypothetical protein